MSPQARLPTWQGRSSWPDATEFDLPDENEAAFYAPAPAPDEVEVSEASEPTPGDPLRSALVGALAGAPGGLLALAIAQAFISRARLVEHTQVAFGHASSLAGERPEAVWLRVAFAALAGMVGGAALGWLMRRLHARAARLVFGAVLVPSVWIAVDAFALPRFAPHLAEVAPFLPFLVGALAYGVCVALVRPVIPGSVPRIRAICLGPGTEQPSSPGTMAFPLVRHR